MSIWINNLTTSVSDIESQIATSFANLSNVTDTLHNKTVVILLGPT